MHDPAVKVLLKLLVSVRICFNQINIWLAVISNTPPVSC